MGSDLVAYSLQILLLGKSQLKLLKFFMFNLGKQVLYREAAGVVEEKWYHQTRDYDQIKPIPGTLLSQVSHTGVTICDS